MDQVQGVLWITVRKRACIGLHRLARERVDKQLWLQEFQRDYNFIEQLDADL